MGGQSSNVTRGHWSAPGQTATCLSKWAMSALTPTPEVIWHRQGRATVTGAADRDRGAELAGGPNVARRATLPDLRDRMKEAARLRRPLGLFVMWAVVDRAMIATD
jgi:hypothetical protein